MIRRLFYWLFATNYSEGTCIYKYTTRLSMMGNRLIDKQAFLRILGRSACGRYYLCQKLEEPESKKILKINRLRRWIVMDAHWAVTITYNTYYSYQGNFMDRTDYPEPLETKVKRLEAMRDFWLKDISAHLKESLDAMEIEERKKFMGATP